MRLKKKKTQKGPEADLDMKVIKVVVMLKVDIFFFHGMGQETYHQKGERYGEQKSNYFYTNLIHLQKW